MGYSYATVEIRSAPQGEAPLWVREKWVGLRLPTVLQDGKLMSSHTFGVLSGPRTRLGEYWARFRGRAKLESGFVVPAAAALEALEAVSPEAATWWRLNASHLSKADACLLFEEACGRICEDAA